MRNYTKIVHHTPSQQNTSGAQTHKVYIDSSELSNRQEREYSQMTDITIPAEVFKHIGKESQIVTISQDGEGEQ